MEQAKSELPSIIYCEDAYSCAEGADALVIVTEWVQFRALDLDRLKATMAQAVIVDLRNIYRPEEMEAAGFTYESIGRPSAQG
jgi:UDPglucose 6-dehydrogenase